MSLFSTKTMTTVSTQVTRAIPDDLLPNAVKTGLIRAIFQDQDIADTILDARIGSLAVKAQEMHDYGRDHYFHGLPNGYSKASSFGRAEVQAVLNALEGEEVTLQYCHMGNANSQHIAWMKLVRDEGYNPATNQLGRLSTAYGKPVYLDDFAVVVPYGNQIHPSSLAQWGQSPKAGFTPERKSLTPDARLVVLNTPLVYKLGITDDYVQIDWVFSDMVWAGGIDPISTMVLSKGSFDMSVNEYNGDAEYFHAKYTKADGSIHYWMYEIGAGTYPTLDAVTDIPPVEDGTFFPFLYFRYFKTNIAELPHDEPWYKTSKKMAKIVGIDFDSVCEGIDSNPDSKDVEQAILMWAVPGDPAKQSAIEKRYLYDFFEAQFYDGTSQASSFMAALIATATTDVRSLTQNALVIADPVFKMAVANGGVFKQRVRGSVGAVGTYATGHATQSQEVKSQDYSSGITTTTTVEVPYQWYRRQVSTAFYDEIIVINLRTIFWIYGSYATIADDTDDILLIPLDMSITENYQGDDREELYARSMHYVYNSRTITEIKWYQSEAFQQILIIAAILITVFSFGSDGGSALGSALAAGNYAAAANLVAMGLLKYVAVTLGVKLFVKLVGPKVAFLVAVIAVVAGLAVNQMGVGGVQGAPWAKDLLGLASNLTKGINSSLQDSMKDLLGEKSDFQAQIDKDTETLEKTKDLLDDNSTLLTPYTIFGENPERFFNRTVHSGNIGVLGLDAITNYVDIALRLPDIDDTLGAKYA